MRILVVGADGLIGRSLSSELRKRGHDVIGTTRRIQGAQEAGKIFLDLAADQLAPIPVADVTIICAAIATFSECRDHFGLALQVNVRSRIALANAARASGGRIVGTSSSVVFDCARPHAMIDWPTAPRSIYGQLMAEAEKAVLSRGGTILRLTKVMTSDGGVFPEWISTLRSCGQVRAFSDHSFCPLPLDAVVDALVAVVEARDVGIFQVSGATDIVYADAAKHLAARLGVPIDRVVAVRAIDAGLPESDVTPFTSLDTTRLGSLTGFRPPQPLDVIDQVFQHVLRHEARCGA